MQATRVTGLAPAPGLSSRVVPPRPAAVGAAGIGPSSEAASVLRAMQSACHAAAMRPRPIMRQRSHMIAAAGPEAASAAAAIATAAGATVEIKQQLRAELVGIDRGIFGSTAAKREAVLSLVSQLEAANPLEAPLRHMDQLEGEWRLLYTTVTITGVKKTKLGLREFVKLGDFKQIIDTQLHTASNVVTFSVAGLGNFGGQLVINAGYQPAAPPHDGSRVDISFLDAVLTPAALEQLFRANYQLLLSIFNPEGWLDVTFVDGDMRVGRDNKGNVFVLERC